MDCIFRFTEIYYAEDEQNESDASEHKETSVDLDALKRVLDSTHFYLLHLRIIPTIPAGARVVHGVRDGVHDSRRSVRLLTTVYKGIHASRRDRSSTRLLNRVICSVDCRDNLLICLVDTVYGRRCRISLRGLSGQRVVRLRRVTTGVIECLDCIFELLERLVFARLGVSLGIRHLVRRTHLGYTNKIICLCD